MKNFSDFERWGVLNTPPFLFDACKETIGLAEFEKILVANGIVPKKKLE